MPEARRRGGLSRRARAAGARLGAALLAAALGLAALPAAAASERAEGRAEPDGAPERIVSLNPSLTAILFALGAGDAVVGVDAWSAKSVEGASGLPTVGGLYSPSLEAVAALEPELAVLVPSAEQRGFRERLDEIGVPVAAYDPLAFDAVLETILALGRRVDRADAALERVGAIRRARRRIGEATEGLASPSVVLVLQREPLYVVAGGSFVHEMLETVGAANAAAEAGFDEPYPRVSREWLVEAAPDVLLDSTGESPPAARYWQQWPSLPAVEAGRVVELEAGLATLPGPWLDRALRTLARAVHGDAIESALEGEGADGGAPERAAATAP